MGRRSMARTKRGGRRPGTSRESTRRSGIDRLLGEGLAVLERLAGVDAPEQASGPLAEAARYLDRLDLGLNESAEVRRRIPEALATATSVLIEAGAARTEGRSPEADAQALRVRGRAATLTARLLSLKSFAPVQEEVAEHLLPLLAEAPARGYSQRVGLIGSWFERVRSLGDHTADRTVRELTQRTYAYKFPRFGTSGIRGVWGRDITQARAEAVTEALVEFLERDAGTSGGHFVVGFDSRLHADELAGWVAATLRRHGYSVQLTATAIPTPVLNFWGTRVAHEGLRGILMCTASHNPPEWHGIKFTPTTGLPATTAITDGVGSIANRRLLARAVGLLSGRTPTRRLGSLSRFDARPAYVDWVLSPKHPLAVDAARIRDWFADKLVVVDEMHGAGAGYLPAILERLGVPFTVVHGTPSPTFGRLSYPAPEPPHTSEGQEIVERLAAEVGLAMDADADRFGVVDPGGRFVHPSEVVTVLTDYLVHRRRATGKVVRSLTCSLAVDDTLRAGLDVTRTKIPDLSALPAYVRGAQQRVTRGDLAMLAGGPSFVTMVGIKYLMEAGRMDGQYKVPPGTSTSDFVIAGEESGGITTGGHVNDKDGIWANLVVLDAMAHYRKPLGAVWDDLARASGREWHLGRVDLDGPDEVKDQLVTRFLEGVPSDASLPAGLGAVALSFVAGVLHDYVELRFQRGDALVGRLIVRGSGTEPICRAYTEAAEGSLREALERWVVDEYDRLAAEFVARCRSPWRLLELLLCTLPTPRSQRAVAEQARRIATSDPRLAGRLPVELERLGGLADTRKRELVRLWIPLLRSWAPPRGLVRPPRGRSG